MNIKLEDLEINNYMIYQDKDSFNFGIDAVMLANFALRNIKVHKNSSLNICDFCTGDLPVPLIMYAKRKKIIGENVKFAAFEIEKEQIDLCKKTIKYNCENNADAKNINDDIKLYEDDIKNIYLNKEKYKNIYESIDVLTCNPPYIKKGSGIVNENDKKILARHEISITFDEICKAASLILKSNKSFYIVHHSERVLELSSILRKNNFEIKKLQFIHTYVDKVSNLVLIEAVKNGKFGVKILEPIIVYNDENTFTEKVLEIYGK